MVQFAFGINTQLTPSYEVANIRDCVLTGKVARCSEIEGFSGEDDGDG